MGLSQAGLAEAISITRNMLVSYENSGVEPKLTILLRLSEFFRIRISALLTEQITDDNFQALQEYYDQRLTNSSAPALGPIKDSDVEQLTTEVAKIKSIYTGLQALYSYKDEQKALDSNTKDLMLLMDKLLDANQAFIDQINSQGPVM